MLKIVDAARMAAGFLALAQLRAIAEGGVAVLDPFSTLVAPDVEIEPGAILWPNVVLESRENGRIRIGSGTNLHPGTRLSATGGTILVGPQAEIGEGGGFSLKARSGETITVGSRARLTGGGSLSETSWIGDGAQILGTIDVRHCHLADGGDHTDPDPDRRGAVLKGAGQARNIVLERGRVIQAFGLFSEARVEWQSFFHPRPDAGAA